MRDKADYPTFVSASAVVRLIGCIYSHLAHKGKNEQTSLDTQQRRICDKQAMSCWSEWPLQNPLPHFSCFGEHARANTRADDKQKERKAHIVLDAVLLSHITADLNLMSAIPSESSPETRSRPAAAQTQLDLVVQWFSDERLVKEVLQYASAYSHQAPTYNVYMR